MMESVHIDFAHLEGHIEPLVRFLEGLFHTRPELLPPDVRSPIERVAPRRFLQTASRAGTPKAPLAALHAQVREWESGGCLCVEESSCPHR